MRTIDDLVEHVLSECSPRELALGFIRYEALRKLNANDYAKLCTRNIRGENFDEMINQLALEQNK